MGAITHAYTIRHAARELGIDEDRLGEIAYTDMDPEHGRLWVYDLDDDGCMAFTADGLDHLRELVADRATYQAQ